MGEGKSAIRKILAYPLMTIFSFVRCSQEFNSLTCGYIQSKTTWGEWEGGEHLAERDCELIDFDMLSKQRQDAII